MPTASAAARYEVWRSAGLADQAIDRADARAILSGDDIDLLVLLSAAGDVRRHYFSNSVSIHVLDNVRNGACPEDCGYCGQSKDSDAPIQPYKVKPVPKIVAEAKAAQERGAFRFCMALSGRGPSDRDLDHMCDAIRQIKAMGMRTCLSTGILQEGQASRLAEAGLDRLNHNLNTSARHYEKICTTHTYDDRMNTIRQAREAGIGLCSGLIVGMDETYDDLLDVAFALREMRSESIPVNFLLPIDGNRVHEPVSGGHPLTPQYCLRVLAMMRLVNPTAEIRMAAGREAHLRMLQPLGLHPANSLFIDGYLLTQGSAANQTLQMVLDAGFKPTFEHLDALPEQLVAMVQQAEVLGGASASTIGLDLDAGLPELQLKPQVMKRPKSQPGNFVPVESVGRPS